MNIRQMVIARMFLERHPEYVPTPENAETLASYVRKGCRKLSKLRYDHVERAWKKMQREQ